MNRPKILVFDSGLGGLTVFDAICAVLPAACFVYVADDVGFPYGRWPEADLVEHVAALVATLIDAHRPDAVVVACNTASTLVLPALRARWPHIPFVGTVPAIKPAAAASRSKIVAVLGTPGTVARDYTRNLIAEHAEGCSVIRVGAASLATIAEADMRGEPFDARVIAEEISPCFVAEGERRTDAIVLACTHYPLILKHLERAALWPVAWIDPAPAIARQVLRVLGTRGTQGQGEGQGATRSLLFTSGLLPSPPLITELRRRALAQD